MGKALLGGLQNTIKSSSHMEQFSVKEYLKNPKRKVRTRCGHDVKILCVDDRQGVNFPVVALCNITRTEKACCTYTENGKYLETGTSIWDLVFAEERDKSIDPVETAFLEKAIKWLEGQCISRNGKIALISIDEFKKAMEK